MYATPFRLIKRHYLWALIAFLAALAFLAAGSLQDKFAEWNRASLIRNQVDTNTAISLAVHELQRERGISSGHLASGGERFSDTLRQQRSSTDRALTTLNRVLPRDMNWNGAAGAIIPAIDTLQGIEGLRLQVSALGLFRDVAADRYTAMIATLFEVMASTAQVADGRMLRPQLALIAFLQAKEMVGQERALLTTMLASRDFGSRTHREELTRVRAQKETYIQQFLRLAEDDARNAYWDMNEQPFVSEVDSIRRQAVVLADNPWLPVGPLPTAEQWFEVSTRKIDAMKALEDIISLSVERSASRMEAHALQDLAISSGSALASFALAGFLLVQTQRGKREAEKDLHLAASVFRNSVEAIVITDAGSIILEANDAFSRISGYTREDVIGKHMRLLKSDRHDGSFFATMWQELVSHGSWEGEIWNKRKSGQVYPAQLSVVAVKDERGTIGNYIAMIVDLSLRKKSEALIEQLRTYDLLTGLLSRDAWLGAVERAIQKAEQTSSRFAVLEIGLDRFKLINESLGHAIGDKVLIEAAQRVRSTLRRHDTAARPGGDRFSIVLEGIDSAESVAVICEKLLNAFAVPIQAEDHELNVSISIGVGFHPGDGNDAATLLRNAESAMHRAKDGGRGDYKFYSAEMNIEGARILALERMLRLALDRGELALHYQPQIGARDGRLVGVEALLRWHNPELGSISPAQFIPIAEETGLIVPIGSWALRTACRQATSWREELGCDLPVAVNLSARQFMREDLIATVRSALDETRLPSHLLELEITEGLLIVDPIGAAEVLRALRAMGVRIAIDDFGTGYSSLAYLKTFPIDRLKMDRTFVRDLPANKSDQAISRAIVALALNLDLEVLAEGVETPEQRDFLASAGCQIIQGYLHGKPMPADALGEQIRSGALRLADRPISV